MGRPLAKRFFGNRNLGSASTAADNGLGGSSVASVTLGTLGSYTVQPTVAFSVPDLTSLGAVRATGTVTSEILSVVVSGTMADYADGDEIYFGDAVITVGADGAGAIDGVTYTARGSFTGALATGAQATTTDGAGTGAEITVTYRAKAVVITEAGSGYTDATDAAPTFSQSVTGTTVLTPDSSAVVGRQEAAIVAYAYVTGNNLIADITKQVSGRRYKVETSEGTLTCKLVTDGVANAAGEMTITATDSAANTYYVSKLTRHKATLVQIAGGSNYVYATGASAPWSFASASGSVVQIANK